MTHMALLKPNAFHSLPSWRRNTHGVQIDHLLSGVAIERRDRRGAGAMGTYDAAYYPHGGECRSLVPKP